MHKKIMKEIYRYIDNIPDEDFIKMMQESENDLWTIIIQSNGPQTDIKRLKSNIKKLKSKTKKD
ncbi:hypothetical protein [uncultured Brachyspira sp.]|uniref:hypothetical protein n=1 Tax=uncultured Brachyspira sp. TaxID=221953 RepID=UPI00262273EB|nr:hypothetical protein [uncultured Brachyspira sp.]